MAGRNWRENTMHTNQAISIRFQSTSHAAAVRTWIKGKLDAFRQTQIAKREITYLRTMDRHLLADMGIDISALGEIYPSLERSHDRLKCETSGFFRLPVNMSTR
jgi:uncharacterized protein YjiS (DUF1127 family)